MIRKLSSFLDIEPTALEAKGVFDAFIGVDTRLFVDPHLLKTTRIPEFADSYKKIEKYYEDILTLLQATERRGDRAWREAFKRLVFREMSGIAIGYGENTDAGSGVGPKLAGMLIESAQEIIRLGIRDPEIFALIGLFEPGFGADRLSDMTIRIIRDDILAYTEMVSRELKVKRVGKMTVRGETYSVPYFDENKPLLFIPSEFLRSLPVALSF